MPTSSWAWAESNVNAYLCGKRHGLTQPIHDTAFRRIRAGPRMIRSSSVWVPWERGISEMSRKLAETVSQHRQLSRRACWAGGQPIASILMAKTLAHPEIVSLAAGFVDQRDPPRRAHPVGPGGDLVRPRSDPSRPPIRQYDRLSPAPGRTARPDVACGRPHGPRVAPVAPDKWSSPPAAISSSTWWATYCWTRATWSSAGHRPTSSIWGPWRTWVPGQSGSRPTARV